MIPASDSERPLPAFPPHRDSLSPAHESTGEAAFQRLMTAIQVSLADAVTRCFLIGALLISVGFLATLLPREIPLRSGMTRHESGEASVAVEA